MSLFFEPKLVFGAENDFRYKNAVKVQKQSMQKTQKNTHLTNFHKESPFSFCFLNLLVVTTGSSISRKF